MKDKLDFEKFSDRAELNPGLAAPVLKGKFTFKNLYNSEEDSLLTFDGDTIYYIYKKDSIVSFAVSDFVTIPEQDTLSYFMRSETDIPAALLPNEFNLKETESFELSFDNGMRPDSIWLNTGLIYIGVESTYKHTGALRITSPSLIDSDGNTFNKVMQISSYSGQFSEQEYYTIQDNTLKILHPAQDSNVVKLYFDLLLKKQPGQGISKDEFVKIDFSFIELEDFETIFGYAGQLEQGIDTIVDVDFGDFANVEGTFAVTNPRLNFNYSNSMGIPFSLDLGLTGMFEKKKDVHVEKCLFDITCPLNYYDPTLKSAVSFNRITIPNIDSILVFPPPTSFHLDVSAVSNPVGETQYSNFINYNSELNVDLDIEIPLEFRANLQFIDTINLNTQNIDFIKEVEYLNLYHTIYNEFPLNFDIELVLYDSIRNQLYDTIQLGYLNQPLLTAAPVDENGLSVIDEVVRHSGFVSLNDEQANNLLHNANKVIVIGSVSSTQGARTVKILSTYKLDFKFGIETKAKVEVN